jgi:hypothetical protein
VLRPDLYREPRPPAKEVDDVDLARAQEYALLSTLLVRAPGCGAAEEPRRATRRRESARCRACRARASCGDGTVERIEREYFDLFIGLGRGELLPYASYYLTGFLTSARWRAARRSRRPPHLPAPLRPRTAGGTCARRARALPLGGRRSPQGRGRSRRRKADAARVTIRKNICTHCSVGCTVIAEVQNGVWVGQEPAGTARSTAARIAPRARRCASSCTATAA